MLSFLHRWDCCWKCQFDTDVKTENYNHHDGEQLFFNRYTGKVGPGTRNSRLGTHTWDLGPRWKVPGGGSHFSGISFLYQNTELKNDVLVIFMLLLYIIARNEEFQIIDKNCTQENVKCHNSTLTRMNRNWTGKLRVFSVKVRIKYINQYKFAISCCGIMKTTILLC